MENNSHPQSLFDYVRPQDDPAVYGGEAGWKGEAETGREAAAAMLPKLGNLQKLVQSSVKARGAYGLTPEEAAEMHGLSRVSIQPRFSELKAKGLIVDSGKRRRNGSSLKNAVVWVSPEFAEASYG